MAGARFLNFVTVVIADRQPLTMSGWHAQTIICRVCTFSCVSRSLPWFRLSAMM
jgi:hypothetical protein